MSEVHFLSTVSSADGFNHDAANTLYEFMYKTVMEAAEKLTKLALVFFSISSLLTFVTLFKGFEPDVRDAVMWCSMITICVFTLVCAVIMWGVITGLLQIRDTLRRISHATYIELGMDSYFRRGIGVLISVGAIATLGMAAIIGVLASRLLS